MAVSLNLWLTAGLIVFLLGLSAFFSSTEIAVFSIDPNWLDGHSDSGNQNAVALKSLLADPHRLLVTILVGNNVVNVAISSLVTILLVARLPEGLAVTAATLFTSAIVLIFGEIVPKSYGLGHAEEWSLKMARPIRVTGVLLYPVVVTFDAITRGLGTVIGGDRHIEEPYTDDDR